MLVLQVPRRTRRGVPSDLDSSSLSQTSNHHRGCPDRYPYRTGALVGEEFLVPSGTFQALTTGPPRSDVPFLQDLRVTVQLSPLTRPGRTCRLAPPRTYESLSRLSPLARPGRTCRPPSPPGPVSHCELVKSSKSRPPSTPALERNYAGALVASPIPKVELAAPFLDLRLQMFLEPRAPRSIPVLQWLTGRRTGLH